MSEIKETLLSDMLEDRREDVRYWRKISNMMIGVVVFLICLMVWQNIYFSNKIENQQTQFIKFLEQYDFSVYNQDGTGLNNINRGSQGDLKNEPKP